MPAEMVVLGGAALCNVTCHEAASLGARVSVGLTLTSSGRGRSRRLETVLIAENNTLKPECETNY